MKVYILMQMDENIIERISTDFRKMNDRAEDLNGGKDVFGPWFSKPKTGHFRAQSVMIVVPHNSPHG